LSVNDACGCLPVQTCSAPFPGTETASASAQQAHQSYTYTVC